MSTETAHTNNEDNLHLHRHLKNHEATKNIPFMMASANSNIAEFAREAIADDALKKPFNVNQLKGKVAKLLKS